MLRQGIVQENCFCIGNIN